LQLTEDVDDLFFGEPRWSPDARRLVVGTGAGNALALLGLNGSKRLILTPGFTRDADWSPDARWIAFISGPGSESGELMAVRPDGSGMHRLLPTPDDEVGPCCLRWSPDGRRLLFVWGGDGSLRVLDLNTRRVRTVARNVAEVTPAWSPDGKAIAYVTFDAVEDEGAYEGSFVGTSDVRLRYLRGGSRVLTRGGKTAATVTYFEHLDWGR
jgi:Tol biopolymer transport system component